MCGRFTLDKKTFDLIQAFVADGNDFADWEPRYSIAPTDVTRTFRERKHSDSGEVARTFDAAIWGLASDIHARLEAGAVQGAY